jgi:hypothetical protein
VFRLQKPKATFKKIHKKRSSKELPTSSYNNPDLEDVCPSLHKNSYNHRKSKTSNREIEQYLSRLLAIHKRKSRADNHGDVLVFDSAAFGSVAGRHSCGHRPATILVVDDYPRPNLPTLCLQALQLLPELDFDAQAIRRIEETYLFEQVFNSCWPCRQ